MYLYLTNEGTSVIFTLYEIDQGYKYTTTNPAIIIIKNQESYHFIYVLFIIEKKLRKSSMFILESALIV